MTKYGEAFYGSDEVNELIGGLPGKYLSNIGNWLYKVSLTFAGDDTLYRLPKFHWFYDSDTFKRARKPGSVDITKSLADYSDDELQNKIKSMQAEIERRKSQDDEILRLARKLCADATEVRYLKDYFIAGKRDDAPALLATKAGIIAGMELQKEISQ